MPLQRRGEELEPQMNTDKKNQQKKFEKLG
jgi:hypothetical protein